MGKQVFANGMEIAHKAGDGKVMAAFPDVCLSPPPPPTGPVPVPYPNTSFAKDLQAGSTTVKIDGKPLALKDQSYFQTSPLGNEAATRNFGGAVVTHTITGKTYFQAHSMDVTVEGKTVCRHVDLTTSNHASYPGSTPPYPNMETMSGVAKARAARRVCPCCNKSDCLAAFQDGEELQSMEDFYGLTQKKPNGELTDKAQQRMQIYKQMLGLKEKHCTCDGKVFPKAPCDVFHAKAPKRTEKIETRWGQESQKYFANFLTANPGAIARFIAKNPNQPAPSSGPTFNKVNHLTPKGAGGCPDNPGNLQPNDLLCATCKQIDKEFTDWQGTTEQKAWQSKWPESLGKLKIKRRTVAEFTPSFW